MITTFIENGAGVWYTLDNKVYCVNPNELEHDFHHQICTYKGSGKQIGKARHDDDIYYDEDEYEDGESKQWDELELDEQIEILNENHNEDNAEMAQENAQYNPYKTTLFVLLFTWQMGTETQTVWAKNLREAKDKLEHKYGEVWNIYDVTNEPLEGDFNEWSEEVAMNKEKENQHCE
jgi:hypothetical protein